MTSKHLSDLNVGKALSEHLCQWGEVCHSEIGHLREPWPWLEVFEEAGIVARFAGTDSEDVWSVTGAGEALLLLDPDTSLRVTVFNYPGYRRHLLAILIEGLVQAGRLGMSALIEAWSGGELLGLVSEINSHMDELEVGNRRLVNEGVDTKVVLTTVNEGVTCFASWDRHFLGQSGGTSELFARACYALSIRSGAALCKSRQTKAT